METKHIREKSQEWQEQADKTVQGVREKAQEWQRKATENARRAAQAADGYVHENPWTVIASVAFASLLLGFFLARSRD